MESADCVDVDRREDTIFQHKVDGNVRELQLEDKCNIGLNKEVIWIVKDGQSECPRQRLGSRPSRQTSQITAPIPHSYLECRYCRHTIQRHHSHRMTTWFVDALREIYVERYCQWWANFGRELTCDVWQMDMNPKPSTRARPKIFAQRSRSSFIIITSWRLHVQVFALGESTGDDSTHCVAIGIQRMPTWYSHKSQDTTKCRSKVCTTHSKKSRPDSCWIFNSTKWTWLHRKHDYTT